MAVKELLQQNGEVTACSCVVLINKFPNGKIVENNYDYIIGIDVIEECQKNC